MTDCCSCCEIPNVPVKLNNCGHCFCKKCLCEDFYDFQWYHGFSNKNFILCPECDARFSESDKTFLTNSLCNLNVLQRKIVYKIYLCPELYRVFGRFVNFGFEYTIREAKRIQRCINETGGFNGVIENNKKPLSLLKNGNKKPDIIYFEKYNGLFNWIKGGNFTPDNIYYTFEYGNIKSRSLMPDLQRELVEYVFHPSRIKCIEQLDEM